MSSDPFHPEAAAEPRHDAAVIHEVTSEMMDAVAHRAAALADGVAHHTIALAEPLHPDDPAAPSEIAPPEAAEAAARKIDDGPPVMAGADIAREESAGAQASRPADASDSIGRYNARVFEMARANMAATTALFTALAQVKSVPEAMALNADHLRRQVETLTSQGRELADLAQKITFDAFQPLKSAIGGDR